jgi:phosphatidyl-myo-inositol alpha-mannosyltransferase
MKIAVTNAFLPSEQPSGVPYQVHNLANSLSAKGHEVTVFSFSPPPTDARYVTHQFPRPRIPSRFFPFVMAYRLAVTDFSSFDVISCHGDNFLLRSPRPIVRTFYGTAADEMKHAKTFRRRLFFLLLIPLENIGAAMADHVVGISEITRASMRKVQTVIPCGVNLDSFQAGKKTTNPTVLFVGTEGGRKRGAWLAELFKKHVLPLIPEAELRMVSDAAGIEPGVRRYGRVSGEVLSELFQSSWAFCLPSTYEGFGVPYIEAMAAGTAVVATAQNAGAREVLAEGSYGAFVDDAHLADTLTRILSDATLRQAMEMRGTVRSRAYSWKTVTSMYETTFSETIASGKARA